MELNDESGENEEYIFLQKSFLLKFLNLILDLKKLCKGQGTSERAGRVSFGYRAFSGSGRDGNGLAKSGNLMYKSHEKYQQKICFFLSLCLPLFCKMPTLSPPLEMSQKNNSLINL